MKVNIHGNALEDCDQRLECRHRFLYHYLIEQLRISYSQSWVFLDVGLQLKKKNI